MVLNCVTPPMMPTCLLDKYRPGLRGTLAVCVLVRLALRATYLFAPLALSTTSPPDNFALRALSTFSQRIIYYFGPRAVFTMSLAHYPPLRPQRIINHFAPHHFAPRALSIISAPGGHSLQSPTLNSHRTPRSLNREKTLNSNSNPIFLFRYVFKNLIEEWSSIASAPITPTWLLGK